MHFDYCVGVWIGVFVTLLFVVYVFCLFLFVYYFLCV